MPFPAHTTYDSNAIGRVSAQAFLIREMAKVLRVVAKAELYDPATGIIDADVLEAVQDASRGVLAKLDATSPQCPEAEQWRPIETAPKNGAGFLSYGRHRFSDPRPGRPQAGDHWWAIIQWDIWREDCRFVFAKDGKPISDWGDPTHWLPLPKPPIDREETV